MGYLITLQHCENLRRQWKAIMTRGGLVQRGKQCLAALSPEDNLAQDLDHLTVRTSSSRPQTTHFSNYVQMKNRLS